MQYKLGMYKFGILCINIFYTINHFLISSNFYLNIHCCLKTSIKPNIYIFLNIEG